MSDSDVLKDISDDLRYYIKETVANSVYKNADDPTPGGGGGGGGGATATRINITQTEAYNLVMDKTFAEVRDAMASGYCYTYQEFPEPNPGLSIAAVSELNSFTDSYQIVCGTITYEAATEDDYPTWAG